MDKKPGLKHLLFETGYTIAVAVLINFINYLFNLVLAREMPSANFAIVSAIISFIYIFTIFEDTFGSAITKYVAQNRDKDLTVFKKQITKKVLTVVLIVILIYLAAMPFLSKALAIHPYYLSLVVFVIIGSLTHSLPRGFLMGMQKIKLLYTLVLVETLVKFGMVIASLKFSYSPVIPILAFPIPQILLVVFVFSFLLKNKSDKPLPKVQLNLKEVGIILANLVLLNVIFVSDIWYVPSQYRAEYSAMTLLGKIVYFGSVITVPYMFAKVAGAKSHRGRMLYFAMSAGITLAVGLSVSLMYKLFGSQIVEIMYKGKYLGIVEILPFYALGITLFALSFAIVNFLISRGQYKQGYFLLGIVIVQFILQKLFGHDIVSTVQMQVVAFVLTVVVSLYFFLIAFKSSKGQ